MLVSRSVPTGYVPEDILLGQNIRDNNGKLIEAQRGFQIGKQYDFSGFPGAGKSTLVGDLAAFGYHAGYPIYKTVVIDADNASWDIQRIQKITDLEREFIEENYIIETTSSIENVTKILVNLDKEYRKEKLSPVKIINPYSGKEEKMMPYVVLIIDTVTSLNSEVNDVGGDGDILANESFLNSFRKLSSLIGTVTNFCDGNLIVIWTSHLKKNKPELGKRVADKEFKSAPVSWKSHLPERLRQKATCIQYLSAKDSANIDSNSHPIAEYGLQDIKGGNVYEVESIAVKSRTGIEGRTKINFMFINGRFDRNMTLLATAKNLGVLKEGSGMYPSAQIPHIFKESPVEKEVMGMKRKKELTLNGYSRPTNLIEARLLLAYDGDDETILNYQAEFYNALLTGLEEELFYELESNNVTVGELTANKNKLKKLMGFLKNIKREEYRDPNKEIELPDVKELNDGEEYEGDDENAA